MIAIRKVSFLVILVLLVWLPSFQTSLIEQAEAQTAPEVWITYPNSTTSVTRIYYARLNDTFRINVTVNSPDTAVWSWQVGLYFNSTMLECRGLGDGSFFEGKNNLGFLSGTIHNDLGYVTISGSSLSLPETTGVMGTGTLMWFEFHVKENGSSLLNLTLSPPDLTCGTKLNQNTGDSVVPISPIVLYDGNVTIVKMGDLGGNVPPEFFKFDNKIDGKDLALFLQCFKSTAPSEAMYLADLGGGVPPRFYEYDEKVDGKDLALFLLCYKGPGP
jgi:hypothetical protein